MENYVLRRLTQNGIGENQWYKTIKYRVLITATHYTITTCNAHP